MSLMSLSGDKLLELLEEKGVEVQEVTRTTSTNIGSNVTDLIDYDTTLLTIFLNTAITAFVYLFVPVILILRKRKYKQKKLKRIAIINGIICFVLFSVIQIELGGRGASAGAYALWTFVGYKLLNNCLLDEE